VRAAPELKTGVTEAVAGFLHPDSGRKCEGAENPDPSGHDTIEGIVRDMQERHERKRRERRAREEEELNTREKRARDKDAAIDETTDAQTRTNGGTDGDRKRERNDASAGDDKNHDTAPPTNKKQKTSLETHREPITPSTRGTKRRSPFSTPSPSPSSDDAADRNASPFAYLPNSKPPSLPYPSPPPKKRVFEKPEPAFGEASFVIAAPHVVGPLMRKRHADIYVEGAIERESKRRRSQENGAEGERGREGMRGNRSGSVSGKGFDAFRRAWDERKEEGGCEL